MGIAVLSRNHLKYLESAADIAGKDPARLVTFRASTRWKAAKDAINDCYPVPIYFVPVGSGINVKYEATLCTVLLNPKEGDSYTEKLLAFGLTETSKEQLWKGKVKSLYSIRNCRRLATPFPMTALIKESDGKPIHKGYAYSYAPVHPYSASMVGEREFGPDEVPHPELFSEGATKKIFVNAYERNTRARNACIRHHGCKCHACGMDFKRTYGEVGKGFIQVHHRFLLSKVAKKYMVDPIKDLIPVCPNCHAMLHKKDPPYTVEELTETIKKALEQMSRSVVFTLQHPKSSTCSG